MTKVYVRSYRSTNKRTVYHTDKDCPTLKKDPIAKDKDCKLVQGLRECKRCSGDAENGTQSGNWDYYNMAVNNE